MIRSSWQAGIVPIGGWNEGFIRKSTNRLDAAGERNATREDLDSLMKAGLFIYSGGV
ncbi:hypothetical protein [Paenibacillus sp. y28]|uniref:hypothetical protein n=1 Tax=Paenibacillus sp. y28 TaxID=3129110 RepID=UPI00301AE3DA